MNKCLSAMAITLLSANVYSGQEAANMSANKIELPTCSFDYTQVGAENTQRLAFYITKDVLNYDSRESVINWLDNQLKVSNQALRNSCVHFQQEAAVIRFVEIPDNQWTAGGYATYQANEMSVVTYNSIIAGLDVDNWRPDGTTSPMGRTGSLIKDDWTKLGVDRVISVVPYYLKSNSGYSICGVANGAWSRPNAAPQLAGYAPYNSWGEDKPNTNIFSTVAYVNNPICTSEDVVAHEVGHTNGLGHERGNQPALDLEDTLGFGFECSGQKSLMYSGVNNESDIPFYSSPEIVINDIPCGINNSSYGVDSVETLHFNLGTSSLHNSPRQTPYQGIIDKGDALQVGDTSTWNFITNARHSNEVASGEVTLGTVPNAIMDQDGVFSVSVVRTDSTQKGSVLIRALGGSEVYSGYDFDSEKQVEFAIGESQKTVDFTTYKSGLLRSSSTVQLELSAPYKLELGDFDQITIPFTPTQYGNMGKVKILNASVTCVSDCTSGVVNLLRENGSTGTVEVTIKITDNGQLIQTHDVTFVEDELAKSIQITGINLMDVLVNIEAKHPALVTYGAQKFENSVGPIDPPPSVGGGGGGGSLGLFAYLSLLLLIVIRRRQ
ncbi:hypothetical protein BCU70_05595 [Vibrio sp. 10N.286.49.C2]|uniref:hypothetical protein n=1 Tax=unclassified Vibrio TaxID=2614977 RepID=UPI000C84FACF|nr:MULTISPECIES: hypothetical protein [unclassified Vibrio]PMH33951.1 hypothetical protein BCU70_05595 [Vibrio sp. 10N.286.49.C2]PMH44210.1 hypothetical protein BCU66_04515 [Vibrio sp. 10N.286.49.B1]PMH79938.1 hypothetical protein BCU58_04255 [Vibrio sp. 10N.286.48.B7]